MRPCIEIAATLLLVGCGARDVAPEHDAADATHTEGATPVTVVPLRDTTLALTVGAPGHTVVLRPLHVRAPFTGTVTALSVADGDRVVLGDELGTLVSRSSAAALAGARAMAAAATTDTERRDAQRALDLAIANLVRMPLRAPESGVVVSHAADAGDLVNEGDDVLVIAPAGAVSFIADVVQNDLPSVRAGQRVAVDLAARATPLPGTVHGILPAASAENLNAPVRIDLGRGAVGIGIGLFGTARITVGQRRHVPVVPESAVLRDDVYGTTLIAVLSAGSEPRAHWVSVATGIQANGLVEIVAPPLDPSTRVIVTGLVGLPEGAPVDVQP
jgi:multidrug efflux pump subunit AcrA (membrane-fusion protein)